MESNGEPHEDGACVAFAGHAWVPVCLDGYAKGHGRDEAEHVVDDHNGKDEVGSSPGIVVGEDSDVEQDD